MQTQNHFSTKKEYQQIPKILPHHSNRQISNN